ncbi:hypothetical protein METH109765_08870 [Mesobacillus thioparans]
MVNFFKNFVVSTGKINPGDVVSHVLPLSEAKLGYEIFDTKIVTIKVKDQATGEEIDQIVFPDDMEENSYDFPHP